MFLRGHDVVGRRAAQRSISSDDSLCSGVEVADCVFFCIASAALSSLLTCSALRYQRRKGRCRNTGQGAASKRLATPLEPRAMVVADCKTAVDCRGSTTHSGCQQVECKTAEQLHRAVSSQMVHTEEALQDALYEKEVLLQQMHDEEQVLAGCQQQLDDSSSQLRKQHSQQSLLSKQSAVIIASLQSKVHEETALTAQIQAELGREKQCVQHLKGQLQAVELDWTATKTALSDARLRISSLRSAKQQSDTQHDNQFQEVSKDLEAAQHSIQAAEQELLYLKQKAAAVAGKLQMTGPAVMQLKEKIAQSEQEKAQLEHALSAQAKHSQAAEAESASANAKANQLEMDLRVVKECLACGRRRPPLAENVAHSGRQQMR